MTAPISHPLPEQHLPSTGDTGDDDDSPDTEANLHLTSRLRASSSPSNRSFSSSSYRKTPARSFVHSSFHGSHNAPIDITHNSSHDVREDTAELASLAIPEAASARTHQSHLTQATPGESSSGISESTSAVSDVMDQGLYSPKGQNEPLRPAAIAEVSEPASPKSIRSKRNSPPSSVLSAMLKGPQIFEDDDDDGPLTESSLGGGFVQPAVVNEGIISQPSERTTLLLKKAAYGSENAPTYGSVHDLENQKVAQESAIIKTRRALQQAREKAARIGRTAISPKSWDKRAIWIHMIRQPANYVPPVILGLLLNILDALSYGMILFPLGQPIFADLGADGISMFYVSCIVSQLVYSLGGSIFRGGIGSEMIEVVPFFHQMAFTIMERVGEGKPGAVLATTILSYSLSSILTGAVFFLMGMCKLGSLIGFFPRHILIGCIGGVGWFLVATGLEVSARLPGNLEYNLHTLRKLGQADTLLLWLIPLVLAIILLTIKIWIKHPLTDATFFLSIIAGFYFVVAAVPGLSLSQLQKTGWIFEAPEAGVPFYHFYSLYDFGIVDWGALASTIPAMLALTFFGILHVPINIPALGLTTGEDNVDVDRELRAHGYSNAISGFCGSIQNYLVYTNTVLFIRSGGNSRVAGVMLAAATFGVLIIGPSIIGYIPIMVVGTLIFFLGFDLMREALLDTWRRVHRLEYATIVIIIVTMGAWDFVIGILIGIVLACVSFVLQTSQISAIRGALPGGVANSTVRRHPVQHRFLQEAGQQIYVMKLAGYLFFGTIVGMEQQIRTLLRDRFPTKPMRFLVLDLYNVDGVDFSAAEAFTRINRILKAKDVELVICATAMNSDVGKSLCNVDLFDDEDGVLYCETLNSALEYCENELLKAFYQQQNHRIEHESATAPSLEVPKRKPSIPREIMFSSPRLSQLHQVATTTLNEQAVSAPVSKWQNYQQPLQLILQTFSSISTQPEDFWRRTAPYFVRRAYVAGSVLYRRGDPPDGFYLLEKGILKAEYDLEQGKLSELMVERTTCGELPFFSGTERTSTTTAERDCVTWLLDEGSWIRMQDEEPAVARELLKISLKLTSERMDAITKYMLLTSG
ncbi:MAG: hypothetical protein Q9191_000202 [Dirinaria sp. TL-2023a]